MNETPIGVNSPKRHLAWSPETPGGRSRKYSIGDTASPRLRQNVSGVIPLNGRFAIPSIDNDMADTIHGLDDLDIDGGEVKDVLMTEEKESKVIEKGLLKLKWKNTVSPRLVRGRKKRSVKRPLVPGQKLITDMVSGDKDVLSCDKK